MIEYSKMTVDELLARADDLYPNSADSVHSLHCAEVKLQQEHIKLADRANELNGKLLDSNDASRIIAAKQLTASQKANKLSEELLQSNKLASEQNETNAKLMNEATEQLASSTTSLKWATWALVVFTAVQAIIASISLFRN